MLPSLISSPTAGGMGMSSSQQFVYGTVFYATCGADDACHTYRGILTVVRRATMRPSCPTRHQPQKHDDTPLPAALHAWCGRPAADSSAQSYAPIK